MRRFILLILLAQLFASLFSQSTESDWREAMFIAFQKGDLRAWEQLIGEAKLLPGWENNSDLQFETVMNRYGYLAGLIESEGYTDHTNSLLNTLESDCQSLCDRYPEKGSFHAVKAGIYGLYAASSMGKAMRYAPKCNKSIQKSFELDGNNPFATVEEANVKFYAPSLFGGDVQEALDLYRESVKSYTALPHRWRRNWHYLYARVYIGKALEKLGKLEEARQVYLQVLAEYPNLKWVKTDLLPRLSEKMEK